MFKDPVWDVVEHIITGQIEAPYQSFKKWNKEAIRDNILQLANLRDIDKEQWRRYFQNLPEVCAID